MGEKEYGDGLFWAWKDENGNLVPGEIQHVDIETESAETEPAYTDRADFDSVEDYVSFTMKNRKEMRQLLKIIREAEAQKRKAEKKEKRLARHGRRLKEKIRRARLKGREWAVLRDKDGGQVCLDLRKRMGESGWMFIRKNRRRVRVDAGAED